MCSDGCVYNLEVDAHHNYFANGFLVHNCHRSLSQSYQDIAAYYPNAVHLGLTATPYRADGRGLGDMYQELVVVASPRQLIDEGFLVEPSVFTVPREHLPDLSSVHVRAGDYESKALEEAVKQPRRNNLVNSWRV
jgi:superfamily II DNA or RNA helicase